MSEEKKTSPPAFTVLLVGDQPTASSLLGALRRVAGNIVLVSSPEGLHDLNADHLVSFLREAKALNPDRRLILGSKDMRSRRLAEKNGWETVQTLKFLRPLVKGSDLEAEAVRIFSPVSWREDIRTRLQAVGLLSLPRVRIWGMFLVSTGVFFFVFFRLLPSAEIRIWPNQETNSFTTNVYLAVSGAVLPVPTDRVRVLPLKILTVRIERSMTFDQVSKNFTGQNARMTVSVFNDSDEAYSLRKGTRLVNQAGMRFRLQDDVMLDSESNLPVVAIADPIDQYGEVLGERGNVPAGVKWDFPGLSEQQRKVVYARNEKPATGGTTSYVNRLTKEDVHGSIDHAGARQRLEQELLMVAKQQVEEERMDFNRILGTNFIQLVRDELTKVVYRDFDLAGQFIGQNVSSIPIRGTIDYTVILYDEDELLHLLTKEVLERIPQDKSVVQDSLIKENMDLNVIAPWDDDFEWVKITADLTYAQRYIINPITPAGAKFGKYVRDTTAGKTKSEAFRIIRNLPEAEKVEIRVWPPWAFQLPAIGSNIAITEVPN